jgi:hypothetical protein
MEQTGQTVRRALRVPPALKALREHKAQQATTDLTVRQEQLAHRGQLAHREQPALQVPLALKAQPALKALLARLGQTEQTARHSTPMS